MRNFREISANCPDSDGYSDCSNYFTDVYNLCVASCLDDPSEGFRSFITNYFSFFLWMSQINPSKAVFLVAQESLMQT